MPVFPFLLLTLCLFAIAYRYYSAFIAAKVLALDPKATVPSSTHYDGQNYYPTNKWVLFGHHFAAITGAGPLIGPVLAAQFGFLPGFLWLVIGVILAGAVHDFVLLTASIRHEGKSIAEIAKKQIGPTASLITSIAILFIIVIALSGLGVAFVNALAESAWGSFTISCSFPIALGMGFYMYKLHKGSTKAILKASIVGVFLLFLSVIFGKQVSDSSWASFFLLSKNQITLAIAFYGLIASILPVWVILCPRDYLSSYMKLGTIVFLMIAVFIVQPELKMPLWTTWIHGGGPIIPGKIFPYVFITIACGAISGFHGLVATGTTPKMIGSEMHARTIGYGAMLLEGAIGVVALIAAASLYPEDYFAINSSLEKFNSLGLTPKNLPELESAVGELVRHRPGGAVSLAVGIAQIFSSLPFMQKLMSYWYHFAIMFEALFVLTTIDTGTRVARFLVQEAIGKVWPRFGKTDWLAGTVISSFLVVACWSGFIFTGSISTIWPLFGVANQLLATISLCIATVYLLKLHPQKKYFLITFLPMLFVGTTTSWAGVVNILGYFHGLNNFVTWIHLICTIAMLVCEGAIFWCAIRSWRRLSHVRNHRSLI